MTTAHRVSYELVTGMRIPRGMYICHRCDNPGCVRPDHLFLGTPKDNMADCKRKGRENNAGKAHWGDSNPARKNPSIRCGSKNPAAKLTDDQVREIRATEHPCRLSRQLGVSYSTTKAIRRGKTWKHVATAI